jgi:hypothetical protein
MPEGTLRAILKQADVKPDDFLGTLLYAYFSIEAPYINEYGTLTPNEGMKKRFPAPFSDFLFQLLFLFFPCFHPLVSIFRSYFFFDIENWSFI